MLSESEAVSITKKVLPEGKIQAYISYRNLYVFQVFGDDPLEGNMDPFYSVNKETGKFAEFSVITDGDTGEILTLFQKAKASPRKDVK